MTLRSIGCATLAMLALASPAAAQSAPGGDWTANGHDAFGTRYSPLAQITRTNVRRLAVAWVYHTGDAAESDDRTRFEATPLVVDGVMYLSTPLGRAIALDPATGRELWRFDAHAARGDWGDPANRGVSTWVDPTAAATAACKRRIFVGTIDARIIALDARTGRPCADFGDSGTVSLRHGLRTAPRYEEEYELTSPPAVINGLVVSGSAIADNNRVNAPSGEVRAYDARTGALRWSWDPVPRDSLDPNYDGWRSGMGHVTGAANAWSVIAADSARDLVFVPTGSPSPDYYGGERVGDNRWGNSIVALRASTGKVVWGFQAVHHDLWDYDVAAPPALATITHDGRRVDVVLQTLKTGQLFVLDRDTGKPVFAVEERAVPASTIAGEHASPTQPFNTVLPPLSPQGVTPDDVWGPTPADRVACQAQLAPLRNEGVFTPPSLEGSLVRPSNVGGPQWGGVAFDPAREIVVVPVNRLASMVQLIPVDQFDANEARSNESRLGDQYTRMHGTPYVMRRRFLFGPSKLPCTKPPFGALVAVDLKTGRKAWEVPLGDVSLVMPKDTPRPGVALGAPNLGGPIITAGGLVFVAGTMDNSLRAFDVETGAELWRGELPAGGRATPMTYEAGGRQFVAIAVGGGDYWGKNDAIVVFALTR